MARIAVHGTGRMGCAIVRAARGRADVSIIALAGPEAPDTKTETPHVGSLADLPEKPDFLIDFTLPDGTRSAAEWCAGNGVPLVSGVTGLADDVMAALRSAAQSVPVLWSPNLALGVNLLADLAGRAGTVLDADVPVHIEDIHHQWKKDAPSGTALMLGGRVAEGRGGDDSAIGYSSVREGEIIGEHTVSFSLQGEDFMLVHRAHDRSIYALGAIRAGQWLTAQDAGFYTARDWLGGD
jgi:4-hydroxy-tetrahydrodipicolinate reductase